MVVRLGIMRCGEKANNRTPAPRKSYNNDLEKRSFGFVQGTHFQAEVCHSSIPRKGGRVIDAESEGVNNASS